MTTKLKNLGDGRYAVYIDGKWIGEVVREATPVIRHDGRTRNPWPRHSSEDAWFWTTTPGGESKGVYLGQEYEHRRKDAVFSLIYAVRKMRGGQ